MDTVINLEVQEWIKALRSGAFPQTRACLHSTEDGGFCCLGVAEVHVFGTTLVPDPQGISPMQLGVIDPDDGEFKHVLTYDHRCELGLYADDEDALTTLNDDQGFTFEQIADVVEKHERESIPITTAAYQLFQSQVPDHWDGEEQY